MNHKNDNENCLEPVCVHAGNSSHTTQAPEHEKRDTGPDALPLDKVKVQPPRKRGKGRDYR